MSLFKKKNKKKKPQFYDENLNIELEYEKLKKNSDEDREFKNIEDMQHVRIQCDIGISASGYILISTPQEPWSKPQASLSSVTGIGANSSTRRCASAGEPGAG